MINHFCPPCFVLLLLLSSVFVSVSFLFHFVVFFFFCFFLSFPFLCFSLFLLFVLCGSSSFVLCFLVGFSISIVIRFAALCKLIHYSYYYYVCLLVSVLFIFFVDLFVCLFCYCSLPVTALPNYVVTLLYLPLVRLFVFVLFFEFVDVFVLRLGRGVVVVLLFFGSFVLVLFI